MKKSIMTLGILGIILCSCGKEELQGPQNQQALKSQYEQTKDGGGDEEDPIIIQGVTQNGSSNPIANAEVVLYDTEFNNPIDTSITDGFGEFNLEADSAGNYAFKVTATGYQNLETGSYAIPESNPITLTMQE